MVEEPIIDKKNYGDQVFDYLFERISNKTLRPGDKLPNERQLSEELGISRPPLREALKALSSIGLLSTRHGGGTYVNDYGTEYIHSILKFLTVCNESLMLDFVQLRSALETESARLAALNASEEEIRTIEAIHLERNKIIEDHKDNLEVVRKEIQRLDSEFHSLLAKASGNKIFWEFLDAVRNTISLQQRFAIKGGALTESSVCYHHEILGALQERNPDAAARAMNEHMKSVYDGIENYIKNPEEISK